MLFNNVSIAYSGWTQLVIPISAKDSACRRIFVQRYYQGIRKLLSIGSYHFNKNKSLLIKIPPTGETKPIFEECFTDVQTIDMCIEMFTPEVYQFGGNIGWEYTSRYLSRLSEVILFDENELNIELLVIDLCTRFSNDTWEFWDIIQRFAYLRGINKMSVGFSSRYELLFNNVEGYYGKYSNKITQIAIMANIELRNSLYENRKDLVFGLREIIPFIMVFVFNMYDASFDFQVSFVTRLLYEFNPTKYFS